MWFLGINVEKKPTRRASAVSNDPESPARRTELTWHWRVGSLGMLTGAAPCVWEGRACAKKRVAVAPPGFSGKFHDKIGLLCKGVWTSS